MAIHINKELLNNDTKGYIKQLQEAHPHLGLAGITRDLLLLSESSGAQYYISTVQGRIVEFVSSAIDGAKQRAASESVRLLPLMWDINRDLGLDSLYDLHTWSIFDQYMLYQSVVIEMLVNGTLTPEWIARVQELSITTGDEEILNLICPPEATAPFVENIISEYTHGQYTSVSEQVLNAVLTKSPEVFGLVEIYARAKVYSSSTDVETTYFDRLANEFGKILSLDPKSSDRLLYLQRICVKFRREPWAKSLLFHLTAIQEWQFDESFIERLRAQTCSLGKFNTPKARYRNFGLDNVVSLDSAVPEHRLLKYRGESEVNNTVPSNIFPIYSDYLKLQSSIFLSRGLMQKALDFSFEEYTKNKLAFDFLAIPDLCRKIEASIRDESFDYISGLIILDIYGKECGEIFDGLKAEIFEEYLELSDKFRPSMLFESTQMDAKLRIS